MYFIYNMVGNLSYDVSYHTDRRLPVDHFLPVDHTVAVAYKINYTIITKRTTHCKRMQTNSRLHENNVRLSIFETIREFE